MNGRSPGVAAPWPKKMAKLNWPLASVAVLRNPRLIWRSLAAMSGDQSRSAVLTVKDWNIPDAEAPRTGVDTDCEIATWPGVGGGGPCDHASFALYTMSRSGLTPPPSCRSTLMKTTIAVIVAQAGTAPRPNFIQPTVFLSLGLRLSRNGSMSRNVVPLASAGIPYSTQDESSTFSV